MIWNRDVNADRNMIYLARRMVARQERPRLFSQQLHSPQDLDQDANIGHANVVTRSNQPPYAWKSMVFQTKIFQVYRQLEVRWHCLNSKTNAKNIDQWYSIQIYEKFGQSWRPNVFGWIGLDASCAPWHRDSHMFAPNHPLFFGRDLMDFCRVDHPKYWTQSWGSLLDLRRHFG